MTETAGTMSEETLVIRYIQGEQEAFNHLLKKFKPIIGFYCSQYYAKGLQEADLFQEGSIGLYTALTKYQVSKGKFSPFAKVHIKNHILNAVKKATRCKHRMLNDFTPIFRDSDDRHLYEAEALYSTEYASDSPTPETLYLQAEDHLEKRNEVVRIWNTMTPIEKQVFTEIMKGKSYKQAAENIGVTSKSIDNAISRIKKKAIKNQPRKAG